MRVIHLIAIPALLLAACSGGGDDTGGEEGATEIDACALITQADAEGLFGHPAVSEEGTPTVDPAFLGECLWTWEAPDYSNMLLAIYVWDNSSGYYYVPDDGSAPLAIGDEGYIRADETIGIDIGWRQEDLSIDLTFFTIGPMVPEATSKLDEVEAIAQQASARL
jgi:hypothetical protein